MASTPEMAEITCPHCGEEFAGWNLHSLEPRSGAVCPRCGLDLARDPGVREDGLWSLVADEEVRER